MVNVISVVKAVMVVMSCNVHSHVYDMMFVLIGLHDVLGTSGGKKRLQLTVKSSNISKVTIYLF